MFHLDLTFSSPAENLACDEALLDFCEERPGLEVLRFWESTERFVVLGYANALHREVNTAACETAQIPIMRRCSGGGTVLQGPGCLNYSLIVQIKERVEWQSISSTNTLVMSRHQSALSTILGEQIEREGCTDLAADGRKFSGNAQRRRLNCLLFHGTFLLAGFNITSVETFLRPPSRQPDYRQGRSHQEFIRTLDVKADQVKETLKRAWNATDPLKELPTDAIRTLAQMRYGSDLWNRNF